MRVGLLTTNYLSKNAAIRYVVQDLAAALTGQQQSVCVFARKPPGGDRDDVNVGYETSTIVRTRLPVTGLLYAAAFAMKHYKDPFDVINVHSASLSLSHALLIKRLFRVPVVVTCHGGDVMTVQEIGYGKRLSAGYERRLRRRLQQSDHVVALSEALKRSLDGLVSQDRVTIIPHGIDTERFYPAQDTFLEKKLGGSNYRIVVLVGRNTPVKAHEKALGAFARIAKLDFAYHLVHVGIGGDQLEEFAQKLGISGQFTTLGELSREEIARVYRGSHVYISMSLSESFGLATHEAMACGLPCVVTEGGANGEAIDNGRHGYVIPVNDEESAAQYMLKLLTNEDERRKMGRMAAQAIRTQYSWNDVSHTYIKVFRSVQ